MSIQTEITRLQEARDIIRNKTVELGIGTATDKIDTLADIINSIENRGDTTANVKEGETYIIPEGYHNGNGKIYGVAGGGNYTLQEKTITPTKEEQNIIPDDSYYGLSNIIIEAIPDKYQDVTSVTSSAVDVLEGKYFVNSDGDVIAGNMVDNGAISNTIDGLTATSVIIPKGYHNGNGTVNLTNDIETALAKI